MTGGASFKERARAKLNLCLHVGARGADGYHRLASLVAFADAGDVLEARPAAELSLALAGPFGASLAGEADNLVLRAARALQAEAAATDRAPAGAAITLGKNLPVASGIGGGSADAAAILRLLNRMWGLDLPPARLEALGVRLGADVPMCIASAAAVAEGIGDVLTPVTLPEVWAVLVNSGVAVPTADVFRALADRRGAVLPALEPWPDAHALAAWLGRTGNDLEAPARGIAPVIADVIASLAATPGALAARMSGSGATCFALYASETQAEAAASGLRAQARGWWVAAARLA